MVPYLKPQWSWAWWCTLAIPARGRLRQEEPCDFDLGLYYQDQTSWRSFSVTKSKQTNLWPSSLKTTSDAFRTKVTSLAHKQGSMLCYEFPQIELFQASLARGSGLHIGFCWLVDGVAFLLLWRHWEGRPGVWKLGPSLFGGVCFSYLVREAFLDTAPSRDKEDLPPEGTAGSGHSKPVGDLWDPRGSAKFYIETSTARKPLFFLVADL